MPRGFHAADISLVKLRDMSAQGTPQLTPASLFEDQARLDGLRLQTYNKILAAVHQRIKWASTQPGSNQMTFFDVPEWQPGCPRYDVKDCILYVVWNLRHTGFKVLYMPYNRLLINWRDQSVKYYQEESPIRQAMLSVASGAPPPVTAATNTGSGGGRSDKKKASAYKPAAEGVAGLLAQGGAGRKSGTTITFI
jgi:hypothetical protein